jgi:hypothetical protein
LHPNTTHASFKCSNALRSPQISALELALPLFTGVSAEWAAPSAWLPKQTTEVDSGLTYPQLTNCHCQALFPPHIQTDRHLDNEMPSIMMFSCEQP